MLTDFESVKQRYADLVREAGERSVTLESEKVKDVMEHCQSLMDEESPAEAKAKKVLRETEAAIEWVKAQEATKLDDGLRFPAEAYVYVPDSDRPSTWKLRVWENPEKKVTKKQLGMVSAALSPGGFRGQKAEIPNDSLSAVKRKVRSAYRALEVADDDMPKWVRESEHRVIIADEITMSEANVNGKGIATVTIIKPGLNASKERYYPAEMLARDFAAFEGAKMYADHPTFDEDRQRPERSIKDWVASLKNVRVNENGSLVGDALIVEPWLKEKLAGLRDADLLAEMGISINAIGGATKGKIDGVSTSVVERIVRVRSVDFVTEPGAGGVVEMYESGQRDTSLDVDIVDLDTLRERRPDLVKEISDGVKAEIMKENDKKMDFEKENRELKETIQTLTTERDTIKQQSEEKDKALRIAEVKVKIDEAVSKSELPDAAKARLTESFKGKETDEGITEAIKAEQEYIAALTETGKVKNMGQTQRASEADKTALREAFKLMHPEWTDAMLDVAANGR
jgi:hypothetical protein